MSGVTTQGSALTNITPQSALAADARLRFLTAAEAPPSRETTIPRAASAAPFRGVAYGLVNGLGFTAMLAVVLVTVLYGLEFWAWVVDVLLGGAS